MNYDDHDPHGLKAFFFAVGIIVLSCAAADYLGFPWYIPLLIIASFAALSLLLTW